MEHLHGTISETLKQYVYTSKSHFVAQRPLGTINMIVIEDTRLILHNNGSIVVQVWAV